VLSLRKGGESEGVERKLIVEFHPEGMTVDKSKRWPMCTSELPTPLEVAPADAGKVIDHLYRHSQDPDLVKERLLIEILDCLRRIDDKLARLLRRPSREE
jgi:hypothetical protein